MPRLLADSDNDKIKKGEEVKVEKRNSDAVFVRKLKDGRDTPITDWISHLDIEGLEEAAEIIPFPKKPLRVPKYDGRSAEIVDFPKSKQKVVNPEGVLSDPDFRKRLNSGLPLGQIFKDYEAELERKNSVKKAFEKQTKLKEDAVSKNEIGPTTKLIRYSKTGKREEEGPAARIIQQLQLSWDTIKRGLMFHKDLPLEDGGWLKLAEDVDSKINLDIRDLRKQKKELVEKLKKDPGDKLLPLQINHIDNKIANLIGIKGIGEEMQLQEKTAKNKKQRQRIVRDEGSDSTIAGVHSDPDPGEGGRVIFSRWRSSRGVPR